MPETPLTKEIIIGWKGKLPNIHEEEDIKALIKLIRGGYYPLEESAKETINEFLIEAIKTLNTISSVELQIKLLHAISLVSYYASDPKYIDSSSYSKEDDGLKALYAFEIVFLLSALLFTDEKLGSEFINIELSDDIYQNRLTFKSLYYKNKRTFDSIPRNDGLAIAFLCDLCMAQLSWPLKFKKLFYECYKSKFNSLLKEYPVVEDYLEGIKKGDIFGKMNIKPDKPNKPFVIPILSMKGGVGKTTMAFTLAKILQKGGHKIGLIDFDYSGSTMQLFFLTEKTDNKNKDNRKILSKVKDFDAKDPETQKVVGANKIYHDNIHFWVNPLNLVWQSLVAWKVNANSDALTKLLNAIELYDTKPFDYIIIDCSPGLLFGNSNLISYLGSRKCLAIFISSCDAADLALNAYNMHWDIFYSLNNNPVIWIANKKLPGDNANDNFIDWLETACRDKSSGINFMENWIDYFEIPKKRWQFIMNHLSIFEVCYHQDLATKCQYSDISKIKDLHINFDYFKELIDELEKKGIIDHIHKVQVAEND